MLDGVNCGVMSITPENPEIAPVAESADVPADATAVADQAAGEQPVPSELSAAPQDKARGIVPVVAVSEAPEPFDHDHQSGGGSF